MPLSLLQGVGQYFHMTVPSCPVPPGTKVIALLLDARRAAFSQIPFRASFWTADILAISSSETERLVFHR